MVFPWLGDGGNNRGKTENKFKDATGVTKIEFIQRSRQPSIQKLVATRDPKLSAPDVEQVLVLVTTEEGLTRNRYFPTNTIDGLSKESIQSLVVQRYFIWYEHDSWKGHRNVLDQLVATLEESGSIVFIDSKDISTGDLMTRIGDALLKTTHYPANNTKVPRKM